MIKIEIRKAKNLMEEKSGFISFSYDNKIVNIMRNQPQRYWHKKEKEWEIPFTKLTRLIPELNKWKIEITGYYKQTEKKIFKTPKGFEFKTKPFQHQKEGFKYGLNHNRFLLGDEQGLGKTKQVIDIALAKKISHNYTHCLIICGVNGLKYNWQSEIEIHSNEKGYILGTRYNKNGGSRIPSNKEKLEDLKTLPDNYFLITNIESFRNKEIVEEVKKLVDKGIIEMVAIDEIHKAKNPSSQQGKGILKVQAKTRIAIT
ncbi:MAG: DEAD/DEAH box helicase family protein, partial [Bacteroidales bacterium]|nr:DEAD/DEAH box helicase family protein [Bacteroidales bacterium]